MQTFLYSFVVDLADACRLFTLRQIARHPDMAGRTQPQKRASEALRPYADSFEKLPGPHLQPFRFRLSRAYRRKHGIKTPLVNPMSQKAEHWLGLGDIWMELAFHGGRPESWLCDVDHQFDVMCRWKGRLLLIEYQRQCLSGKRWKEKWNRRREWIAARKWNEIPTVVLVNTTGQQDSTVHAPSKVIHVRSLIDIHRALG